MVPEDVADIVTKFANAGFLSLKKKTREDKVPEGKISPEYV